MTPPLYPNSNPHPNSRDPGDDAQDIRDVSSHSLQGMVTSGEDHVTLPTGTSNIEVISLHHNVRVPPQMSQMSCEGSTREITCK